MSSGDIRDGLEYLEHIDPGIVGDMRSMGLEYAEIGGLVANNVIDIDPSIVNLDEKMATGAYSMGRLSAENTRADANRPFADWCSAKDEDDKPSLVVANPGLVPLLNNPYWDLGEQAALLAARKQRVLERQAA